jgi:hypothetical protein
MKNYICGICGTEHKDRDRYLTCVTNCVAKEKIAESEAKKKRLEEVNAALNRVKQAKKYYEEQLADFKAKYPEEYKMNFKSKCDDCNDWLSPIDEDEDEEPIIKAKIDGKSVSPEVLFKDPDCKYIAKLLGILD